MKTDRLLVLLLACMLATVPATGVSQTGPAPTPTLEASNTDVQAPAGPASAPLLGYLATGTVQAPEGEGAVHGNLISEETPLDTSSFQTIPASVAYRTYWSAWTQPRSYAGAGFQVHTFGSQPPSTYATVDAGTPVQDGDFKQVAIGKAPSDPLFPPRETTEGGQLSWEPVDPVRLEPRTTYHGPGPAPALTGQAVAVGFMATLRVDGGGLNATENVTSPTLEVVIPNFNVSIAAFTSLTDLPQIERVQRFGLHDTEDGGERFTFQVTVEEGSQWPESGDELPTGTWKSRIRVVAVGHSTEGSSASQQASHGTVDVLQLGPRSLGTETRVVPARGTPRTIDPGPSARIEATPEGQLVDLQTTPWPLDPPALDAPTPASPGLLGLGATSTTASVSTDSTPTCPGGQPTPPHAAFIDEGRMSLSPAPQPGLLDVCSQGHQVGQIGLPVVEVDGQVHAPEMEGQPNWWTRSFGDEGASGTQLTGGLQGTAGPVAFELWVTAIDTPWGPATVYPWIQDVHALDGQDHTIRLGIMADPDVGAGEQFLALGEVPQLVEGPVANEPLSQTLAGQPHEVTAGGELRAQLTALDWTPLHVVADDGDPGTVFPTQNPGGSPELLTGGDVATFWPANLAGTHETWPYGEGSLAPIPFTWGTVDG